MLTFIVIGLGLATHLTYSPAQSEHPLVQKLSARALEQFLAEDLKTTRNYEEFLSNNINLFERSLRDQDLSPANDVSLRYKLIGFRERLKYLTNRRSELESWFEQRRLFPNSPPTWEVFDRLDQLDKAWDAWEAKWDAGRVAPMPHEVKR